MTKEKSGLVRNFASLLCFSLRVSRFGKSILSKLIDVVCQYVPEKETKSLLDIGTGNGHVLQRLSRRGFLHLTGIDYSENSIALAREQLGASVPLQVMDIISAETSALGQFDVAIDKGTLDAILLCAAEQRPSKRQAYLQTVHQHVKDLLFLVSCNWTRTELMDFFHPSKDFVPLLRLRGNSLILLGFTLEREVETPTLTFGGRQGKTVTFLVLRRNTL